MCVCFLFYNGFNNFPHIIGFIFLNVPEINPFFLFCYAVLKMLLIVVSIESTFNFYFTDQIFSLLFD